MIIHSSEARRVYAIQKAEAVANPAGGPTDIIELDVTQISRLAIQITNAGFALDQFIVQGKAHPDGAYMTLLSAAADYTAPAGIVVDASGDLTTLGLATGWLILDVLAFSKIKIQASANGGTGSVSIYAGGA